MVRGGPQASKVSKGTSNWPCHPFLLLPRLPGEGWGCPGMCLDPEIHNVLPTPLLGETQGTPDWFPPPLPSSPLQLFFSLELLLFVLPILGWMEKGMWGTGRALGKWPKFQLTLFRQKDLSSQSSFGGGQEGLHYTSTLPLTSVSLYRGSSLSLQTCFFHRGSVTGPISILGFLFQK